MTHWKMPGCPVTGCPIAQSYAVLIHLIRQAQDPEWEIQTLRNSLAADLGIGLKINLFIFPIF